MGKYSSAIYCAEKIGYWVTPEKPSQIVELRDLGLKGVMICPGGTSTSFLATKEVLKKELPCVALAGGMSRAERMCKGVNIEKQVIKRFISVLNTLEMVFLLVSEDSANKNYPLFSHELTKKLFLKKDEASNKLINMYR